MTMSVDEMCEVIAEATAKLAEKDALIRDLVAVLNVASFRSVDLDKACAVLARAKAIGIEP